MTCLVYSVYLISHRIPFFNIKCLVVPLCSLMQEVICWSCAAAVTCLVYTLTAPAGISIPYGTCMGLIFGLCLYLLRGTLLEELYKVWVAAAVLYRNLSCACTC